MLPFYLKMMGLNAVHYPVPYTVIAEVSQQTSDEEVMQLLRGSWRPRVMGAWLSAGREDPLLVKTLLWSLTTSLGSLTAPPLASVAVFATGSGAMAALQEYLGTDVAHSDGSAGFIGAAIQHLGGDAGGCEVHDRHRTALDEMMVVVQRLAEH
ncbi:MAG TPA: hypothetical protein VLJ88_04440 [Propionibacteriaceae bacterium]|nr:hypothetical protein [Propionibacteriaceae bacterium]